MAKTVELRRHTASDGDVLTTEGVEAALAIGERLSSRYDLIVSSGAQRATQTIACFLAGRGAKVAGGVIVDPSFRSEREDRWFAAARASGGGDIEAFKAADPDLVLDEAKRFGDALRSVFALLPDDGRALVVGHSPMNECAVYGLTGRVVPPVSKGAGVLVVERDGSFEVDPA